jgi:hypothetical protein
MTRQPHLFLRAGRLLALTDLRGAYDVRDATLLRPATGAIVAPP